MRLTRLPVHRTFGVLFAGACLPLAAPLRAFAASADPCIPPASVPEAPIPVVMLLLGAAAAAAGLVYLRHRRGLVAAAVSTLGVVVLCGALLGGILAAASSCPPSQSGGVQGIATGSPLTGADIPWITGGVLIAVGSLLALVAVARRRGRSA